MGLTVNIEKQLKDMTLNIAFETVDADGITGILGASGCGKSMTLKCIAGIVTPDRGRIVLNNRVLFDSEQKINLRVQERRAGYLFQNYALFPHMTVRQNIEISLTGKKGDRKAQADQYMELLCISELADSWPGRLSGGQQQRVAIARILASKPDVLMLDEPFSAMDAYLKENLQLELLEILREYQGDVLMVTHNRDEIYRFCRNIHVLEAGKQVVSGKTKEVFKNPQVAAAAKLTGCKNVVSTVRVSEYELRVPAWDIVLKFSKRVPEDTKFIGIRAHYLRGKEDGDTQNLLHCSLSQVLEDPFEVTLILNNGIWWKISKEIWDKTYDRKAPEILVIPEESILFLRET